MSKNDYVTMQMIRKKNPEKQLSVKSHVNYPIALLEISIKVS